MRRALDVGNSRQALTRLDEDEKGVISNDTPPPPCVQCRVKGHKLNLCPLSFEMMVRVEAAESARPPVKAKLGLGSFVQHGTAPTAGVGLTDIRL